jgi:hypothetical protein
MRREELIRNSRKAGKVDMTRRDMPDRALTDTIINAAISVHKEIGFPGGHL